MLSIALRLFSSTTLSRGASLFQNELWNDGGRWDDDAELEPLFGSSAWQDTGFWRDQSAVA
jgi:hypothetical protein